MKGSEVPKGVLVGALALVACIIAIVAYSSFFKAPPQADPSKVSAERLLDPDHRGGR